MHFKYPFQWFYVFYVWPGLGVIILLLSPERATHLNMHQNFSQTLAPTHAPFSNPSTSSVRSDSDRIEIHLDLKFALFRYCSWLVLVYFSFSVHNRTAGTFYCFSLPPSRSLSCWIRLGKSLQRPSTSCSVLTWAQHCRSRATKAWGVSSQHRHSHLAHIFSS